MAAKWYRNKSFSHQNSAFSRRNIKMASKWHRNLTANEPRRVAPLEGARGWEPASWRLAGGPLKGGDPTREVTIWQHNDEKTMIFTTKPQSGNTMM